MQCVKAVESDVQRERRIFMQNIDFLFHEGVTIHKMENIMGLAIWVIWDDEKGTVKHYVSWTKFAKAARKIAERYVGI